MATRKLTNIYYQHIYIYTTARMLPPPPWVLLAEQQNADQKNDTSTNQARCQKVDEN